MKIHSIVLLVFFVQSFSIMTVSAKPDLKDDLADLQSTLKTLNEQLKLIPTPEIPSVEKDFQEKVAALQSSFDLLQSSLQTFKTIQSQFFAYDWKDASKKLKIGPNVQVKNDIQLLTIPLNEAVDRLDIPGFLNDLRDLGTYYSIEKIDEKSVSWKQFLTIIENLKEQTTEIYRQFDKNYQKHQKTLENISDIANIPDVANTVETAKSALKDLRVYSFILWLLVLQKDHNVLQDAYSDTRTAFNKIEKTLGSEKDEKSYFGKMKEFLTAIKEADDGNLNAIQIAQRLKPANIQESLSKIGDTLDSQFDVFYAKANWLGYYYTYIRDTSLIDQWLAFLKTVNAEAQTTLDKIKSNNTKYETHKKDKTLKKYLEETNIDALITKLSTVLINGSTQLMQEVEEFKKYLIDHKAASEAKLKA